MNIILVHNYYSSRCGEDAVFDAHVRLLRNRGHSVETFTADNRMAVSSVAQKAGALLLGAGNPRAALRFRRLISEKQPDVIHIHNLVPLLSPSIVDVAHKMGVPSCMTLHNYRFTCPEDHHVRDGKVCLKCSYGSYLPCIRHGCGGRLESVGFAFWAWSASALHHLRDRLDGYVILNRFQQEFLKRQGFDSNKIYRIPNMVEQDELNRNCGTNVGAYVAFVGRISQEKGLDVLVKAAALLPQVKFKFTGIPEMIPDSKIPDNIEFVGWLDRDQLRDFYCNAKFIVLPSLWYEGQPICIIEAASYGKPAIVSDLGGMADMVDNDITGVTFPPGQHKELAAAINRLWHSPDTVSRLGNAAREHCLEQYSEDKHYKNLVNMYDKLTA